MDLFNSILLSALTYILKLIPHLFIHPLTTSQQFSTYTLYVLGPGLGISDMELKVIAALRRS